MCVQFTNEFQKDIKNENKLRFVFRKMIDNSNIKYKFYNDNQAYSELVCDDIYAMINISQQIGIYFRSTNNDKTIFAYICYFMGDDYYNIYIGGHNYIIVDNMYNLINVLNILNEISIKYFKKYKDRTGYFNGTFIDMFLSKYVRLFLVKKLNCE